MQKEISYFQELNQGDEFCWPKMNEIYTVTKVGDFDITVTEKTGKNDGKIKKKVNYGRLIWLLKRGTKNG